MQRLRAAFVVTIVDPIHEAWFRELATDRTIDFRVFALRDKLSHRPGWQTRHDAGFGVEIVRSFSMRRHRRLHDTSARDLTIRFVPVDLVPRLWRFRPDVIVVSNVTELVQALLVKWLTGARVVRGCEETRSYFARNTPVRRWLKSFMMRRVDMHCAYSSAARELLLDLGIPSDAITFTPWAVDNEKVARWAAEASVTAMREKLDLRGFVFVTVAALIPLKGIDRLLAAWKTVAAAHRDKATLVIVGDGPERSRLTEYARAHELTNVRFAGHLPPPEVAACLAASHVFVLPTLGDNWGLVVNEAMAARLPVLCSRYAGSCQDLVRNGVNGFVFDPGDRDGLASLLCDVMQHPERLVDMSRASADIISEFTIPRSIASLVQALHAVRRKSPVGLEPGSAAHD